jgi:glycosyltransferase involved in cell wall biosynthesis
MNEKKKVLIVNNNFDIGGVQRSLINLLDQIKDSYDITLFIFSNSGEYKNQIPAQVKLIEASPLLNLLGISQEHAKQKGYVLYFLRAVLSLYAKVISNYLPIRLLILTQKRMSGFDTAISFLHNCSKEILYGGCNEFVLHRVEAKEKITFVHCDFSEYGGNTSRNRKMYEQFDKIVAVSEGCRQSFVKAVPKLATKTHCVLNCHNYNEYINKANDNPFIYSNKNKCLNILTVARLGQEKGILRGIEVIAKLNDQGYSISWYIVGEGEQRKLIDEEIIRRRASNYISVLGNKENPYRYMKNADIFFLPSYHEAAPMVHNEAKCLGIPIITTNTTSANEMVEDGKEGFVCGNNEHDLYEALKLMVEQPERLLRCKEYLLKQGYTNEKALNQFHELIKE